jgi:hypothetical protein
LIPGPVVAPRTLADYHRLRDMLEDLIAKVGADESHPLAAFMDRVGTLVEQYESTHLSEIIESKQKRWFGSPNLRSGLARARRHNSNADGQPAA